MAAGGPSSFCLVKRNQNRRQQKCFFALKASTLQNGQNLGWNYLPPCFARTCHPLPAKLPMPCHSTTHHRFGRFHPKLPLLTLLGSQGVFSVMKFAAKNSANSLIQ